MQPARLTPRVRQKGGGPETMKASTALISVSDKTGLVDFGLGLTQLGVQIYSTGKTFQELERHLNVHEAGGYDKLPAMVGMGTSRKSRTSRGRMPPLNGPVLRSTAEFTGFDEKLNGRLKTLYSTIFEAILTTERDQSQREQFKTSNGSPVLDMVVVNFYPFKEVVARPDVGDQEAVENIDIGGPAMVRSAAKNYEHVVVVVDPQDYADVLERIKYGRRNTRRWRRSMALKALQYVADYDMAIANFFANRWGKRSRSPVG